MLGEQAQADGTYILLQHYNKPKFEENPSACSDVIVW